jgi:hypothetical protein
MSILIPDFPWSLIIDTLAFTVIRFSDNVDGGLLLGFW